MLIYYRCYSLSSISSFPHTTYATPLIPTKLIFLHPPLNFVSIKRNIFHLHSSNMHHISSFFPPHYTLSHLYIPLSTSYFHFLDEDWLGQVMRGGIPNSQSRHFPVYFPLKIMNKTLINLKSHSPQSLLPTH